MWWSAERREARKRQRNFDRVLVESFLVLKLFQSSKYGRGNVGIIQGLPGSKPERVYIPGFNVESTTIPKLKGELREMILDADAGSVTSGTMSEPLKELLFKIYSSLQER